MTTQELQQIVEQGHIVLDVRMEDAYDEAHIPGAIAAPFGPPGWGPAVKEWLAHNAPGKPVLVFGDNPELTHDAAESLHRLEIAVSTWDQGMDPWKADGLPVISIPSITVDTLHQELDQWTVIDVREPHEFQTGIIPQARTIPLSELAQRMHELAKDQRYAIICAHGNRSQSVTAYLAEQGYLAHNVIGGMALWHAAGHPVVRP